MTVAELKERLAPLPDASQVKVCLLAPGHFDSIGQLIPTYSKDLTCVETIDDGGSFIPAFSKKIYLTCEGAV